LVIIPNKKQGNTVTIRKTSSLLLAIMLVVTMAGQAAAGYIMSCQGTTACCCMAPMAGMGMNGAMPGGMNQNCCTTPSSEPCDIETNSRAAEKPFLSGFVTSSVEHHMTAGLTAPIVDPGDVAFNMAHRTEHYTDRGSPPIYLQIQTFLC
jgi:hypothetical protein